METWYKVVKWVYGKGKFISPVEVVKSTDKTVWVKETRYSDDSATINRHAISSEYDSYFRTFTEAKEFALNRQLEKMVATNDELKRQQADYAKIYDQVEYGEGWEVNEA